jgi:hypothetical protein
MRAYAVEKPTEELIAAWMKIHSCDREAALKLMAEDLARSQLWRNDLYQVEVREMTALMDDQPVQWLHLNIRRCDGYPGRDWRHFQQIKNELVGPECEAIELYPAESRLVDTSNKYHLWACKQPGFRFPVGFGRRDVDFDGTDTSTAGLRQSPPMQFKKQESTDA